MTRMTSKALMCACLGLFSATDALAADPLYNLNVEIIQVRDDNGLNPTPLEPIGGSPNAYAYESQVNEIWGQAGIQVTFTYSTWDNTEAQRLDSTERSALYGNNTSYNWGSGDAMPSLGVDRVQIFYVLDHPGTGYNGTSGTGWVDNPVTPGFARNAGNAQLYIDGTFSSNGRSVMANEGSFVTNSLSGTVTHEIGHLLGLRHVEDVNNNINGATDSTQDPDFFVDPADPNLMWGAGFGPSYSGSLSLVENFALTAEQIDAAIYNGLRLDPDGNGTGVLQAIPEPSTMILLFAGSGMLLARRRRAQA